MAGVIATLTYEVFRSYDRPWTARQPARFWFKSLGLPTFVGLTVTVTLLDGDNFNFVTSQLHGLTDPFSDK
jgi:hypothetical protein